MRYAVSQSSSTTFRKLGGSMRTPKHIIIVLAWAILAMSCDNTPIVSPSPVPAPAPAPPAPADVWNISARMTAVTGSACVAEALRAQMSVVNSYTLSMTSRGSDAADMRLSSIAGDFNCTFRVVVTTTDAFTTFGQPERFSCGTSQYVVQCADRTYHPLFAAGWDISGEISGRAITGGWTVNWWDIPDPTNDVDAVSEFTGSR
jgi:hypothetical protein